MAAIAAIANRNLRARTGRRILGGMSQGTLGFATVDRSEALRRYSRTAIALHWTIAELVLATIPLGVYGANAAGDLARTAKDIHKPIGILILALTLVRIGWRLSHMPPPLPDHMSPALRRVARGTHIAFYALLLILPLSGWWMSGLAALHIVAALKHHFADRDAVLIRMLPGGA